MIVTKVFEVRDRCTLVPVVAMRIHSESPREEMLLNRAGFPYTNVVMLVMRFGGNANVLAISDVHEVRSQELNQRTFEPAYRYINDNFDTLPTGAVIDVEYILGEAPTCKESGYASYPI